MPIKAKSTNSTNNQPHRKTKEETFNICTQAKKENPFAYHREQKIAK